MFSIKLLVTSMLTMFLISANAYAGYAEGLAAYNKKDYESALKEWQKVADDGNVDAQNNIGVMYEKGQGLTQSDEQAIVWYTKAANQGSASSQFNLGIKYYKALGIPQDYKQAFFWFKKAAEQGDPRAQFNIGLMYGVSVICG